jgi:hypothetical protein
MKKLLLIAATLGIAVSSNAQSRLSLYEEFSGENCGPCAASNPGLWTLLTTGANPTKILLIKYQSPIPSAGPIYNAYKTVTDNRMTYYSVPFAPYGRLNGTGLGTGTAASGSPGHIANLIQADIDAATTAGSPFKVTVTANYNATGDSVYTTVKVDCIAAYSGTTMKLRIGMIEHLVYATPPGTNGEKEFHNVVREMYPDANGTTIANAWTVGMTQTYTIGGLVKSFVKKSSGPQMVAWLQDDASKAIPQAGVSAALPTTFATNATANPVSLPGTINCVGATLSAPTVNLKNSGTATTLTSATIYYRVGTGAWANKAWSGSLAPGASTMVTLNPITLPATAGDYVITDSVVLTVVDQDKADNVSNSVVTVVSTAPKAIPYTNDFEASGFPAGYTPYDLDGSGSIWINGSGGAGSTYCHSGIYMPWFKLSTYSTGATSILVMPTPAISGNVALDFWEAYAQTSSSSNDKLEVVYSTNCGTSWTSLWSATGSAHATTAPTSTYWLPDRTATPTGWVKRSLSLNSLPSGSILGFRATDGGGNNLFIDDVNVRAGLSIKGENLVVNAITVSPNPAKDFATLSFHLNESSNVDVQVVDALGRVVVNQNNSNMTSGAQEVRINTSDLAAGLYLIKVSTGDNTITERLSVVK